MAISPRWSTADIRLRLGCRLALRARHGTRQTTPSNKSTDQRARIIARRIGEPGFGGGDNTLRAAMMFSFREIARTVFGVGDR
jgi:hypothetical protein